MVTLSGCGEQIDSNIRIHRQQYIHNKYTVMWCAVWQVWPRLRKWRESLLHQISSIHLS